MFKKLRQQLACIGCTSPSEAYRKVYIERNNNPDLKLSQRRIDLRSSLGVYLDPSGQQNGAPNAGQTCLAKNCNGNSNPEQQKQYPYSVRKSSSRHESETIEYSSSVEEKPTEQKQYQTYPYRRNGVGKRPLRRQDAVDECSNSELDDPHVILATSSLPTSRTSCIYVSESENSSFNGKRQTLALDNELSFLHQFNEDRTTVERYSKDDNFLETKNNKRDSINHRCRSRSFVSSGCPPVGGASLRKRSLSVSDSDGCLSSISGEGVENTLVSLVKHEWYSQLNVNNTSCQLQNGGSLKGILKRRSRSCTQVNGDSDGGATERKPRTNSVSFVDTKFNESQLFSSSRYKRDDDDTTATKRTRNGTKRKQWLSGGGSRKNSGRSLSEGKPPLPQRSKVSGFTKAFKRYQSLRTIHNKSPPLNADGQEALQNVVTLTPDSGTYASSLSSDDVISEGLYQQVDSSGVQYLPSKDGVKSRMVPNGERLGDVVPRTNKHRRSRRHHRSASILLDKVDPDESMDSRTTSSQMSDDASSNRPLGAFLKSDPSGFRGTKDSTEHPNQSVIRNNLESSGPDYVSSSVRNDDVRLPDQFGQNSRFTSRQNISRSEALPLAEYDDETNMTLCDDDVGKHDVGNGSLEGVHDSTLCEYVNKLEIGHNRQASPRTVQSKSAPTAHVTADVEDPLPCHVTQGCRATSVENLKMGKKITTLDQLVTDNDGNISDFAVENTGSVTYTKPSPTRRPEGITRDSIARDYNKDPAQQKSAHREVPVTYSEHGYNIRSSVEVNRDMVRNKTSGKQDKMDSLDQDLRPSLPTGSPPNYTESDPDYEEMSDLLQHGTDDDLKSFLDHSGFRHVFISRNKIRIGRLIMTDEDNAFCMCAGSYDIPKEITRKDLPYSKQVTIQVYTGKNDKEDRINLLKNAMALRQLTHRYVHYVYGVVLEGSPYTRDGREVMIIHERTHYLVTLKRLLTWAKENNPELLTLDCAVMFALQLCEGLHYLEKKGIIHGNLSSHTVRLDNYCNIKIGGIEQFPVSSTHAPIRWMSLETLNTGDIQPKSIVWTFGVLLWEIVSLGARPYHNLKTGLILYRLNRGYRLPCPTNASTLIYELLSSCWMAQPQDRPTFVTLHESLTHYKNTLSPSKPPSELFPDREEFWNII